MYTFNKNMLLLAIALLHTQTNSIHSHFNRRIVIIRSQDFYFENNILETIMYGVCRYSTLVTNT